MPELIPLLVWANIGSGLLVIAGAAWLLGDARRVRNSRFMGVVFGGMGVYLASLTGLVCLW